MNLAEMGVGDVSIDLGGRNVGVTEESLDRAEVGAVHQKVGGERMTKSVGRDVLRDAGGAGVFFDNTLDGAGSETTIVAGGVDGVRVARVVEKEGGQGIIASGEVVASGVGGGLRDEDWPVFLTLAADEKFAAVEVDRVAIEIN